MDKPLEKYDPVTIFPGDGRFGPVQNCRYFEPKCFVPGQNGRSKNDQNMMGSQLDGCWVYD